MSDIDFERAALLMDIMHKVSNIAPKATSILGLAQAELNDMNDAARDIARDKAKEAEARRVEAATAEHEAAKKAEAEANASRPAPRVLRADSPDLFLGAERDPPASDPNNRRDANVNLADRRV